MLVLSRRLGESVKIGDDIEVILLGTKGCQARIGIKAPKKIEVHRSEIYERIQQEKQTAQGE